LKIHEYQAKDLLKQYDVPIQDGVVITSLNEADSALDQLERQFQAKQFVVKAQIHAGGRGKGGGVKFSPDRATAKKYIENILGMQLVTHQTGPGGQLVRKVMVAEALDIEKEFYLAITLDRATGRDVIMVSSEGGVDIEEVAEKTPEKILRVWIDPLLGLRSYQSRRLASTLGLSGKGAKQAMQLFANLYRAYRDSDASIAEINPLVLTQAGDIKALDAKFNFDDNALYRQKEIQALRDLDEEDPTEVEAGKYDLNYIKLDGTVGCMVNGAGLAMATMDIIKLKGGEPANFLDVGGGANVETVRNGFRIILADENVKAVLINIFGGIVRCDRVANGVIQAVRELGLNLPVVVRLAGTNAEEARVLLDQSGLTLTSAESMQDAAEKVVALAAAAEGRK
jgi:succinyl-CoA synthetase beta subunit